jgi:hypothetical protein
VASDPDGPHAESFRAIAARVREGLMAASRPAPKIVIEASGASFRGAAKRRARNP